MSGVLASASGPRHTPSGLPTLRFLVKHTSSQEEAGRSRNVEVETELVAFGPVARDLALVAPGTALRLAGFVDRRSARDPRLELHVTEFGILAPA
ncbi:MAG: primosomal replication protein N [Pseudomonadota bacterium]